MKLTDTYESPVISAAESATFGMQSSGKMFKMVISGLYSNKAQSITREIWSNAFDAHAMCGKEDVPFDVNLPNRFKSEFTVRDFGEGLSHEWILTKYTIVGFSSKEDTNLAVGKWGVGRMSPLSYIDTFSVTSVHKGKKAVYNVTMAADGAPTLNVLVPPMDTEEPSGLKISFPVNPSDVNNFCEAAKRVSMGFKVKPTVSGQTHDWPTFDINVEGEGYKTFKSFELSGVVAQMGCVIYPVDLSQLNLGQDHYLFRNMNILLEAPIGSVEVTASREDLSYGSKEPTAEFLKSSLMKIKEALVKDTQAALDQCENSYQAYKVYTSCKLPGPLLSQLKYLGKPMTGTYEVPESISLSWYDWNKGKSDTFHKVCGHEIEGIVVGYKNGPKKDTRIETRLRSFFRSEGRKKYIRCIQTWNKDTKSYEGQDYKKLEKFFGVSTTFVSGMSDAGPVSKRSTAKVYDFNWSDVTVDMEDGGVYVKSYNGDVQGLHWSTHVLSLKCAGDGQKVIANKSLWKKFESHPEWTDITEEIKREIRGRHKEFSLVLEGSSVHDELKLGSIKSSSGLISLYYELIQKIKDRKSPDIHPTSADSLLRVCNLTRLESQEKLAMKKLAQQIKKEYPLLEYLSWGAKDSGKAALAEYIRLVDKDKKEKN